MTIKQFNATYMAQEDRILFRFNTQDQSEYRLWFTTRVTLFILAATSHLLTKKLEQAHSIDAAKALNEFEKQAILDIAKGQNVSGQNYEAGTNFPLGFDPILVMDVTCALTKNGEKLAYIESTNNEEINDSVSIDFVLPGGANLNLNLAGNMMRGVYFLLDQLRQNALWGEAILTAKNDVETEVNSDEKKSSNISFH
jgi:hypothetical protein